MCNIYLHISKKEWKEIMKKFKGQTVLEFAGIAAVVLVMCIAGLYSLSENLSELFKSKNPAKTFNKQRILQYENPQNLITGVNVTVTGISVQSPIEKIVEANLTDGTYSTTNGTLGRLQEMAQIMQEYTVQLNTIVNTMPNTVARTNYVNALNSYKAVVNTAVTKIAAAGNDGLEVKMALLEMMIKLNDSNTLAANLKTNFTAYLPTLLASSKKQVIDLFTTDLLNFANGMEYSTSVSLYSLVLSQGKLDTLAQDLTLINQMYTDLAGYSENTRDQYAHKIDLTATDNYIGIAPSTYTDAIVYYFKRYFD